MSDVPHKERRSLYIGNMDKLLEQTVEIVKAAGELVMSYYKSAYDVADKSPDNPVTDADFASDTLLKERLLVLFPHAGWLSEETIDTPERLEEEYVWCVDPIDGTKEFIMGIPEFTISVALVQNGHPVLAVIFNPGTGELYTAERGKGFHFNGEPGKLTTQATLEGATIDASRSERKKGEFKIFEEKTTIRTMGSVAYKLARVAAGQCDATWSRGPKHEWDVCAGTLLVTEAGGTVSDLSDQPLRFNQKWPKMNGIVADNGVLHEEIMAEIAKLGPARKEDRLSY